MSIPARGWKSRGATRARTDVSIAIADALHEFANDPVELVRALPEAEVPGLVDRVHLGAELMLGDHVVEFQPHLDRRHGIVEAPIREHRALHRPKRDAVEKVEALGEQFWPE